MDTNPSDAVKGQRSEVNRLDLGSALTPIRDGDHIAGAPPGESGEVDEGAETGPDARVRFEHHERGH
jgi:hypothetical protein